MAPLPIALATSSPERRQRNLARGIAETLDDSIELARRFRERRGAGHPHVGGVRAPVAATLDDSEAPRRALQRAHPARHRDHAGGIEAARRALARAHRAQRRPHARRVVRPGAALRARPAAPRRTVPAAAPARPAPAAPHARGQPRVRGAAPDGDDVRIARGREGRGGALRCALQRQRARQGAVAARADGRERTADRAAAHREDGRRRAERTRWRSARSARSRRSGHQHRACFRDRTDRVPERAVDALRSTGRRPDHRHCRRPALRLRAARCLGDRHRRRHRPCPRLGVSAASVRPLRREDKRSVGRNAARRRRPRHGRSVLVWRQPCDVEGVRTLGRVGHRALDILRLRISPILITHSAAS